MESSHNHIVKVRRKESWWFFAIRKLNLCFFNFWWLFLLAFIGFLVFMYFFCFRNPSSANCCADDSVLKAVDRIEIIIENCCNCNSHNEDDVVETDTIPQQPRENCRVHFSGLVMGGEYEAHNISKIYSVDINSEYVGEGSYPDNSKAFPKAVASSFDGIAIDKGTRLILYSEKNFQGEVLLNIKGPAIINNVIWKNDSRYKHCNTDTYPEELQENYPVSVRKWSESNMHIWSKGSCKIECE